MGGSHTFNAHGWHDGRLGDSVKERQCEIEVLDDARGQIEFIRGGQREPYMLKPLRELYGSGNGETVDPQDETFMPLFMAIESEIVRFDSTKRRLTDSEVALALNTLSMSPEATSNDPLVRSVQCNLRLTLSLNNYSRPEVRTAIRRVGRSVARHCESRRGRAYIDFIADYV